MTTRIGTERILVIGDPSSIEKAGLAPGEGCEVDLAASLEEGLRREEAAPYDRVIVDPSAISGPPIQVITHSQSSSARETAALVEAEERKLLAESAGGVGLWEWDLVTGEAEWDPACKALYGLPPDAEVSLDVFMGLVHPDDRDEFFRLNEECLDHPCEFFHTFRAILPDGTQRWFQNKGRSIADGTGAVVRMLGASVDITDRKEAEDALIEQGQLLSATIESADTLIAYLDREFRFVMANEAYIKGSGHTWAELSGRNHFELFPDEENEAIFRRVRDTGEAARFNAKPFEYADQPWRGVTYWDWSLVPVKDIDGEVIGLVFSLHDVTDVKRAEERILRSNERLTILSDTANELLLSEKPLSIIQGLCERVMEHLDCQVFLHYTIVEERGCLHLSDWAGIPAETARAIEWIEPDGSITAGVAGSGKPFVASRILERTDEITASPRLRGLRAYACYPLMSQGGRVVGTLAFATKTRDAFAADELSMIQTVADEVATAMERVQTIEAQKELYDREHHIADVLQQALVPPDPPKRIGGYRFAVRYRAALHEAAVGGDFYDIFDMGGGRIGVLIGDVAGKGLEAAIRVSAARHSIRAYAYTEARPGKILSLANDAICRDEYGGERMLTALLAVIDSGSGAASYASAGHGPMFCVGGASGACALPRPGVPLGVLPGFEYGDNCVPLRQDDRIVLVTDGITEARHAGHAFFGEEGVREYLEAHRTDGAEALAEGMMDAACAFAGGALQDDAAVVVIERCDD